MSLFILTLMFGFGRSAGAVIESRDSAASSIIQLSVPAVAPALAPVIDPSFAAFAFEESSFPFYIGVFDSVCFCAGHSERITRDTWKPKSNLTPFDQCHHK